MTGSSLPLQSAEDKSRRNRSDAAGGSLWVEPLRVQLWVVLPHRQYRALIRAALAG